MTTPGPEPLSEKMNFKVTASLRDAIVEEATRQGMHKSEFMRTVIAGFIAHTNKENK